MWALLNIVLWLCLRALNKTTKADPPVCRLVSLCSCLDCNVVLPSVERSIYPIPDLVHSQQRTVALVAFIANQLLDTTPIASASAPLSLKISFLHPYLFQLYSSSNFPAPIHVQPCGRSTTAPPISLPTI